MTYFTYKDRDMFRGKHVASFEIVTSYVQCVRL